MSINISEEMIRAIIKGTDKCIRPHIGDVCAAARLLKSAFNGIFEKAKDFAMDFNKTFADRKRYEVRAIVPVDGNLDDYLHYLVEVNLESGNMRVLNSTSSTRVSIDIKARIPWVWDLSRCDFDASDCKHHRDRTEKFHNIVDDHMRDLRKIRGSFFREEV